MMPPTCAPVSVPLCDIIDAAAAPWKAALVSTSMVMTIMPLMSMLLNATEAPSSVYWNEPMLMFRSATIDTPSWPVTSLSWSSLMAVMAEAEKASEARAAANAVLINFMLASPRFGLSVWLEFARWRHLTLLSRAHVGPYSRWLMRTG